MAQGRASPAKARAAVRIPSSAPEIFKNPRAKDKRGKYFTLKKWTKVHWKSAPGVTGAKAPLRGGRLPYGERATVEGSNPVFRSNDNRRTKNQELRTKN